MNKNMIEPKRNYVKIIIGAVLILSSASRLPSYMHYSLNNTEANAAIATSIVIILGGFYLVYKGFYPPNT